MKLRIKGNSLRLRLSRSEVDRLLTGVGLEETIYFAPGPNAHLTYALQQEPSATTPMVNYSQNRVAILLPIDQANTWGTTDQVGITSTISMGEFGTLNLLIEKDFGCLDRSEEDNQDTFANPHSGSACQFASE